MKRRRLPGITDLATAMCSSTDLVLAYTPHVPSVIDRLAYFVDRILRATKPAPSLRLRADRVIE